MNKIDLHVHTKSVKGYDDEARNVDTNTFVKAMDNSGVKYIGITNHNTFDLKQYDLFKKAAPELLIFPGIELDVLTDINASDKDYKNINLIFNPSFAKRLADMSIDWDKEHKLFRSLDELVKTFDEMKPIYLCDHKARSRRFEQNDIKKLDTLTDNPVIADVNNDRTKIVLGFNEIKSLLGSDNKDWENYEKKSDKLGEITWDLHDFSELYRLLKFDDEAILKTLMSRKDSHDFKIKIDSDETSIKIIDGLNVIFGGKGTGKSKIIEGIKNQFDLNKIKYSYYKASDKDLDYEKAFPKKFPINQDIKEMYSFIDEYIAEIKKYPEEDNNEIESVSVFYEAAKNVQSKKFQIVQHKMPNLKKPSDVNVFIKLFNKINDVNNYLTKESKTLNFLDEEKQSLAKTFSAISQKVIKAFLDRYEQYYINKDAKGIIKIVRDLALVDNGIKTAPEEIGLFNVWKERMDFKQWCKNILKYSTIPTKYEERANATVPDKGEIDYLWIVKPYSGDSNNDYKKNGNLGISRMNDMLKIIKKIASNDNQTPSSEDIKELKDIMVSESLSSEDFMSYSGDIYKVNSNGEPDISKKVEISDGEKAALLLAMELEKSNKFVLLDEPSTYLGGELVSKSLIPKIKELKKAGTNIVIATHDANLAINSLPINMIYRKYDIDDKYETHEGNWWERKFIVNNDFTKIVTDNFEGGMDAFNIRKEIYTNDFENENNK